MDVTDLIRARRTIFKFKPEPIPRDVIESLLEFGVWAPNHHLTEPWRFVVIGEEMKETLAQRYREIQKEKAAAHVSDAARDKIGAAGYNKFMSKPTILAVACVQEGDEQRRREDYAAACCAMQNIQLAAWSMDVGMQWSTGPITREEETYHLLGFDPDNEYIIGFFYMGYPAEIPQQKRRPARELTRWTE